jgi:hypothetical protein
MLDGTAKIGHCPGGLTYRFKEIPTQSFVQTTPSLNTINALHHPEIREGRVRGEVTRQSGFIVKADCTSLRGVICSVADQDTHKGHCDPENKPQCSKCLLSVGNIVRAQCIGIGTYMMEDAIPLRMSMAVSCMVVGNKACEGPHFEVAVAFIYTGMPSLPILL